MWQIRTHLALARELIAIMQLYTTQMPVMTCPAIISVLETRRLPIQDAKTTKLPRISATAAVLSPVSKVLVAHLAEALRIAQICQVRVVLLAAVIKIRQLIMCLVHVTLTIALAI
jgi:hypothetical protein